MTPEEIEALKASMRRARAKSQSPATDALGYLVDDDGSRVPCLSTTEVVIGPVSRTMTTTTYDAAGNLLHREQRAMTPTEETLYIGNVRRDEHELTYDASTPLRIDLADFESVKLEPCGVREPGQRVAISESVIVMQSNGVTRRYRTDELVHIVRDGKRTATHAADLRAGDKVRVCGHPACMDDLCLAYLTPECARGFTCRYLPGKHSVTCPLAGGEHRASRLSLTVICLAILAIAMLLALLGWGLS